MLPMSYATAMRAGRTRWITWWACGKRSPIVWLAIYVHEKLIMLASFYKVGDTVAS